MDQSSESTSELVTPSIVSTPENEYIGLPWFTRLHHCSLNFLTVDVLDVGVRKLKIAARQLGASCAQPSHLREHTMMPRGSPEDGR